MLLDYHGLTITESKTSSHRRAQFIVICSVIASCFAYSVIISGALQTIQPYETPFPGGTFCYRQVTRDYGASMGIGRRLQKEILEAFPEKDDEEEGITVKQRKKIIEDKVYHVYLDNPEVVGGSNMRWMSGVLVSDDVEKLSYCDHLFDKNPGSMKLKELNKDERYSEKKASDLFEEAIYQSVELPPVNSVAIKFPFSNGFSSALVFNYKVRIQNFKTLPEAKKVFITVYWCCRNFFLLNTVCRENPFSSRKLNFFHFFHLRRSFPK